MPGFRNEAGAILWLRVSRARRQAGLADHEGRFHGKPSWQSQARQPSRAMVCTHPTAVKASDRICVSGRPCYEAVIIDWCESGHAHD